MDTKQTVQIVIGKWVLHYSIIASRVRRCTTHQPMRHGANHDQEFGAMVTSDFPNVLAALKNLAEQQ